MWPESSDRRLAALAEAANQRVVSAATFPEREAGALRPITLRAGIVIKVIDR
jgi:hypothetical protein